DVNKYCAVGECFTVKFFGGGRLAFIDQRFDVVYGGGSLGTTSVLVNSPVYFRGAGLTAGAEGTWKVWHGLGLYSGARFGLVSGKFRQNLTESMNNGSPPIVDVTEKYNNVIPTLELTAGVCWQNEHWRFAVGYELANWFNM